MWEISDYPHPPTFAEHLIAFMKYFNTMNSFFG